MSDGANQSTLSGEEVEDPEEGETYHAKIVRLCHSEGLPYLVLGYSAKILIEGSIVAGTMGIVVLLPLLIASWYGVEVVTYFRAFAAWGSVSATIYAASYCLLENIGDPGEMFADPEADD